MYLKIEIELLDGVTLNENSFSLLIEIVLPSSKPVHTSSFNVSKEP